MTLEFYMNRILACPDYGFVQGHEILSLVCSCAANDPGLSEHDSEVILELAMGAHIQMMEDNFNGNK